MKLQVIAKTVDCACDVICKAIERYIAKENTDLVKELQKAGYLDAQFTVEQAEALEEEIAEVLQGRIDEFVQLLKDNPDASLSEIVDKLPKFNKTTAVTEELSFIIYNRLSDTIPHIAETYVKNIDKELTLQPMTNRTSAWIERWSNDLAELMNVNSEDRLKNILSKGISNGDSVADVANSLLDNGVVQNAVSARRTALTEMLTAHSVSAQEAFVQSPAVLKKRWRHSGAYRNMARENHIDMDSQMVEKTAAYELIGADGRIYHPLYPRDVSLPAGERINCHCISQPIVDDDIIGLSLEEREKLQGRAINTDNKAWKKEQKALARDNKKKYQKRRRNRNKTLDNSSKSGTIKLDDILIGRSVGAKALNYDILDPATGEYYQFAEGSKIQDAQVFAGKGCKKPLKEEVAKGLAEQIGGKASDWQHCKGVGVVDCKGDEVKAEVHWFQEKTVGKHKFKIKEWLDEG